VTSNFYAGSGGGEEIVAKPQSETKTDTAKPDVAVEAAPVEEEGGTGTGVIIGIVVGAIVLIIVVITVVVLVMRS
jgi:hypothetical protein